MARNAFKLTTTMIGENFVICWPQMAKNALKLSTMVGENFEICWHQMARNALKLSTMVGELWTAVLGKNMIFIQKHATLGKNMIFIKKTC